MPSSVVQFRLAEEEEKYLREQGFEPNAAAKESLLRFIQSLRFRQAAEWGAKHPVRQSIDAAKAARAARRDLEKRN